MMTKCRRSFLILLALSLLAFNQISAGAQASSPVSGAKREETQRQVQLQLLVASNIATAKTDYPPSLEAVVKQLKSSLSFKNHYLVATFLYNLADGSNLEVSDVTYKPFQAGEGLAPTFLKLGLGDIKPNPSGESVHISRFRFEMSKRMFTEAVQVEGSNTPRQVFNTVNTSIYTELNVAEGVPTIVGTTSSGLSDGVLVLVITVNHSGGR